jgi:hypothetical protein
MPWFSNLISAVTGTKKDVEEIKTKVQNYAPGVTITDAELEVYIDDINTRIKKMVKDLKSIYSKYGVQFSGFKSLDLACTSLLESLKDGKEQAYNSLIKLESSITAEQKRHVALIKMAVATDGKKVMDKINADPEAKQLFNSIFGERDVSGQENSDGIYQRLWSEIHKISEYIIMQKNKVYH